MYNSKEAWVREYQLKTIPSSFKKEPSDVLSVFAEFLKSKGVIGGKALDIGCGTGRNSLYLAKMGFEVYGIDIANNALNEFEKVIKENKLGNKIHIKMSSITEKQNFPNDFFDIGIDVSTFFHLITEKEKLSYLEEVSRILKNKAYLLQVQFLKDDEYYSGMLEEGNIFLDKNNGTKGVLYSNEELISFFSKNFDIVLEKTLKEKGKMLGKSYERNRLLLILQKHGQL